VGPGWVRPVADYIEFSDAIKEKFGIIFGQFHPRYAFEFDANTGTGFFINENTIVQEPTTPPVADAGGPYTAQLETQVDFDGSGSYDTDEGGSTIVQYDWKYYSGDSWHMDEGPITQWTYSSTGDYTVTLRVTDDEGEMDTDTAPVTIYGETPPPTGAKVIMDDVNIIEEGGTNYGYLRAEDVDEDIGTCEITLSWNPTVANVVNVDDSDFEAIFFNVEPGTMNLIASSTQISHTGDFIIGRIEFQAVGSEGDSCDLQITSCVLLTADPTPISIYPTTIDGELTIGPNGNGDQDADMNDDGSVNAADVTYLAKHLIGDPLYATLYGNGDVNNDGSVNSGDVRYLAMFLVGDQSYDPLYP